MTPLRPLTLLYAVWCVVVLATFAFANAGGYSAFAAGGRPSPLGLSSGLHHK